MLTIGNSRPLESVFNRQLAIGLGYFLWILLQLIPRLYNARFNSRLLTNLQQQAALDPAEQQATENMLTDRFNEAMTLLKNAVRPPSRRTLTALQRPRIYQLPGM